MESEKVSAVFFDIGNTLGSVIRDPSGRTIERIDVLDGVLESLNELRRRGLRLGIISDRGTIEEREVLRAMREAGLLDFFEARIILFGPKQSADIFRRAARLASLAPRRCLFVGEDEPERRFASEAGMKTAADPRAAVTSIDDQT